ncbi:CNDH2 protein, partial [Dromas ardeola]|nr:CNDH2 protein [Dromas ardeola]
MEEVESRFLHLLQPIRDLTKNWEVDVAAQLGEYLEELDQICISFDNGKTTMNFIEAALVIQGSACIYSRKVEYLYSLVYQTLDFISNKKREKLPSSVGQDGKDADATFGVEEQEEFLSLDDIRDSSQANVDMRKDHQPNAVDIVPLTPMSLVLPEEAEKRDNPLFSRKGEVLASRRDFRMNTCTPHATGAFLLELAGFSPTGLQDRQRAGSPSRAAGTGGSGSLQSKLFCDFYKLGLPEAFAAFYTSVALPGAAGPDDDDMPRAPEDDMEMIPAAHERIEAQRSVPQPKGYVLRERAHAKEPPAHVKEMLDPWQSLDPFADSEDKPFKKGRPFLVPHGLDDVVGGKRKRKGPRKLQDFMKWFSAAYNDVADGRKTRRKGPTFADLEVLYWKQLKERMAAQRKLQSQAVSWGGAGTSACPAGGAQRCLSLGELVDPGGALSGSPLPADDFAEHEDMQPEAPEELREGELGECWTRHPLNPHDLVIPLSPQELFMANSQKYAQETELSQHIRRWEDRMGPLLQEQASTPHARGQRSEERATFDIHGYGDTLASRCGELGQWRTFASLVEGQPPFEVCRYMLASLQLANDYVVELAQEPGLEQALDTMRLRLLTHRRPHERFHTFQPPSACP